MPTIRAYFRFFLFAIVTILIVGFQTILLPFYKGRASYIMPQLFQWCTRHIFGIKVIVEGEPAPKHAKDRQTMYVGNHLSYFDIPVIGSLIRGSFVARGDLSGWPVFGYMSKMQQTAFISRQRQDAVKGKNQLDELLKDGKDIIIFAEGTSSDGAQVLPFKSSLFILAMKNPSGKPLMVQPFTISLLEVEGKPADISAVRDLYAWHSDMTLPPHISAFARLKGVKISVKFHEPRDAADYKNRKVLCQDCFEDVSNGLETFKKAA